MKIKFYLLLVLLVSAGYSIKLGNKVDLNGYSSFEFQHQFSDHTEGDQNASFDADLFDLVWNIQATPKLRINADLTWEHGSATEDKYGNVAVEYAFAEYLIHNWFRVRMGKMFSNFGIYNEIHTAKPAFLTVKEPYSTNKTKELGTKYSTGGNDYEGRFYPRWQNGIAILGNGTVANRELDYVLQFSNGERTVNGTTGDSENPFEADDNIQKAIGFRARMYVLEELRLGASFYTDWEHINGTAEQKISYAGHLEWYISDLYIEAEFVHGRQLEGKWRYGLTGMLAYTLPQVMGLLPTPYFRYEFIDPDDGTDEDQASLFIYGINIQIDDGLFLKIDGNTYMVGTANQTEQGARVSGRTEIQAALAVGF